MATDKLSATRSELSETEGKLTETRSELTETRSELTETESRLTETEGKLKRASVQLDELEQRLVVERLSGLALTNSVKQGGLFLFNAISSVYGMNLFRKYPDEVSVRIYMLNDGRFDYAVFARDRPKYAERRSEEGRWERVGDRYWIRFLPGILLLKMGRRMQENCLRLQSTQRHLNNFLPVPFPIRRSRGN